MQRLTPEDLASGDYELLGEMTHATLLDFVVEYFLRRRSWLTDLHHLMSLLVLVAAIVVAWQQGKSFLRGAGEFVLAFVALLVVLLPLHEALHAVAYRMVGARDIRWDYSLGMGAVWVIAHRFVAARSEFIFVALVPFVLINAALIAAATAFPAVSVFLLFLLLWHLHGCAGDWGLLNFVWLNRRRGFWTWDDAVAQKSYFFGRRG